MTASRVTGIIIMLVTDTETIETNGQERYPTGRLFFMEIQSADWYKYLLEDLNSILTTGVKESRDRLIRTYHEYGSRILDEMFTFERHGISDVTVTQMVARDTGKGIRTIQRAVQCARQFPDYEMIYRLPEGENISWHKLVNHYLVEPKPTTHDPKTCPNCGFILSA